MAQSSKAKTPKMPNTEAIGEAWERALMLQDRSFLESVDKKQIKLTLENCLAELDKRYGQKTSSIFPDHAEWDKLNTLCTKFVSLLGKTKTDYGAWDSSIRLIGGKYNKVPLRDFIEKIISRLGDLPIPPCTSIYNAIQQLKEPNKEPDVQAQLQAIYEVIRSRSWLFNVDSKPWVEWLRVIRRHRIAIDKILLELAKNESIDQKTAAFLLFRQMHHEQLMWITQYHQATKSTVDYRTEYTTFEEYCRKRWDITARHANRLMLARGVVENIKSDQLVSSLPAAIPENEAQARRMAGLSRPQQFEVAKIVAKKPGKHTTKDFEEAANIVTGAKPKATKSTNSKAKEFAEEPRIKSYDPREDNAEEKPKGVSSKSSNVTANNTDLETLLELVDAAQTQAKRTVGCEELLKKLGEVAKAITHKLNGGAK